MQLSDAGDMAGAEAAYRAAAAAAPGWCAPIYNLGLLYKYERRWPESLEYNQRAVVLSPDDQGAWWNLAIAATALGDGRTYYVFNVLQLLVSSGLRTFVLELATTQPEALAAVETIAKDRGGAAEDWGMSTSILRAECSRGVPHKHTMIVTRSAGAAWRAASRPTKSCRLVRAPCHPPSRNPFPSCTTSRTSHPTDLGSAPNVFTWAGGGRPVWPVGSKPL